MTEDQAENAAVEAINAKLAPGFDPLPLEVCRVRYGAAFDALVSVLREKANQ
jgi:hypothetical protein